MDSVVDRCHICKSSDVCLKVGTYGNGTNCGYHNFLVCKECFFESEGYSKGQEVSARHAWVNLKPIKCMISSPVTRI